MRIGGKQIEGLNIEEIIIPRGDGAIVLMAQAIPDYDEFDALCPQPKPRVAIGKNGKKKELTDAKPYLDAMNEWGERRVAYMIIKSLEATADLEWDTVSLANPDTWLNYKTELKSAGFTDAEQVRILNGVLAANGLDEAKVEAARQRFLAGRQAESEASSSLTDEADSTPSGEPASE